MSRNYHWKSSLALLVSLLILHIATSSLAQEVEQEPVQESEQTPEESPPPTAPPAQQPPIIVYTTPAAPAAQNPTPQTPANPLENIRRMPRRLKPIEGEDPPPGYVEGALRNKKLIIAGSVVFGVTYVGCLAMAQENALLAIPLAGPMIAGFSYSDESVSSDFVYSLRLYGTLGTIAQATGIALFTAGMISKKMHWLRQDVAGISYQVAPTMVGYGDPGVGISGSF